MLVFHIPGLPGNVSNRPISEGALLPREQADGWVIRRLASSIMEQEDICLIAKTSAIVREGCCIEQSLRDADCKPKYKCDGIASPMYFSLTIPSESQD